MGQRIKARRDTAANWTTTNPVLQVGELGLETDSKRIKIGDGATAWNALKFIDGQNKSADMAKSMALSIATVAHNLGVKPTRAIYGIRCLTADIGYAVGDELYFGGLVVAFSWNATNMRISSTGTAPAIPHATTGTNTAITAARWEYFIRVYA
jgi:hypothetical protein